VTTGPDRLSVRNPNVSHLRRLTGRRRARSEHGQYVIEGPTLLLDALASGVALDAVYVDADDASDEVARLVAVAEADGVKVRLLDTGVLARVADAVTPHGAIGVALGRPLTFDTFLATRPTGLVVVLGGVSDPGNAGTMVRTAEATGATAVVFCEGSVDPLGPKTVRASSGSVFRVPLVGGPDVAATVEQLHEVGLTTAGTAGRGGVDLRHADLPHDLALIFGAESTGLPAELLPRLDRLVTIPMAGRVESLNVAVAGALVCFEWTRRTDGVGR
jgi:TrmH family RNA methyltransferase